MIRLAWKPLRDHHRGGVGEGDIKKGLLLKIREGGAGRRRYIRRVEDLHRLAPFANIDLLLRIRGRKGQEGASERIVSRQRESEG